MMRVSLLRNKINSYSWETFFTLLIILLITLLIILLITLLIILLITLLIILLITLFRCLTLLFFFFRFLLLTVDAPRCGVQMRLGCAIRARRCSLGGSEVNTSKAAPATLPD